MRRLTRWLVAGMLAAGPLAMPVAARSDQEFNTFVWKVTAPGAAAGTRPDYLVGTMHLPVGAGKVMPAVLKSAIVGATTVVTEANTADVKPEVVARYMFLRGPKTLKQLLPAAAWPKLLEAAQPMGLPPEQLLRMEPWFLNVGLTLPAPDGNPVIDDLVKLEAQKASVHVAYLEGAEEQLQIMDSVKQEEDVRQLVETLNQPVKAKQLLTQLRTAYFAGDQKALERLVFDRRMLQAYPDFYQKLLFDRNARWVPKLDTVFKREDAVVAVGLGHLLGDKGLVTLLKAKGYKVEPLAL